MLMSLNLNIEDILKLPVESMDILEHAGDVVKLEIQDEHDLFNEDDFKADFSDDDDDEEEENNDNEIKFDADQVKIFFSLFISRLEWMPFQVVHSWKILQGANKQD